MAKTSTPKTFPFFHHSSSILFSPCFSNLLTPPLFLCLPFFFYSYFFNPSPFVVYSFCSSFSSLFFSFFLLHSSIHLSVSSSSFSHFLVISLLSCCFFSSTITCNSTICFYNFNIIILFSVISFIKLASSSSLYLLIISPIFLCSISAILFLPKSILLLLTVTMVYSFVYYLAVDLNSGIPL